MHISTPRFVTYLFIVAFTSFFAGTAFVHYLESEAPAQQSRVEQIVTASAFINAANQPAIATEQPVVTETQWVMPTDRPHPHCENNVDYEIIRGTFEFHFYTTHGYGPYPDCTEEGFSSISIYYVQEFLHYHFFITQEGFWEISARNR